MKDTPRLSLTACRPSESWRCQRQVPLRAGRFGAAVRGGLRTGLLRSPQGQGCLMRFHRDIFVAPAAATGMEKHQ